MRTPTLHAMVEMGDPIIRTFAIFPRASIVATQGVGETGRSSTRGGV